MAVFFALLVRSERGRGVEEVKDECNAAMAIVSHS